MKLFQIESQGWDGLVDEGQDANAWLPCLNNPAPLPEVLFHLNNLIMFDADKGVSYPYRVTEV